MSGVLEGKVAVITGGCSGLGAAAVDLFEAEGAKVVIADIQEDIGRERESRSSGNVKFVHCDVRSEEQYASVLHATCDMFGQLTTLFNNAGLVDAEHLSLEQMDVDVWDNVMALNLRAGMIGMKHAVPIMRRQGGGSIIHTASIAGQRVGISTPAYSVSKAALIHLTRKGAMEFAKDSIRVNAICPGVIPTEAFGREFGFPPGGLEAAMPEINKIFSETQPIPKAGTPRDIAQLAVFLASDASRFITGQDIACDGGMTNMPPPSLVPTSPDSALQRMLALASQYGG
jgi:NAD(P)-dependent dehydrogenase (short-subunit alcohol dehydrogenase family)